MKYSDQFADWLVEEGYTHCFYVAGGNIMHILNSVRTRMTCVPFVHEVSAGIAAEYFNESSPNARSKAFALVTAGPGLTNILTAMAGAFLESRDLLVVGGQVKSSDLGSEGMRQRGIQEINGMALADSLTVGSLQIREPLQRATVIDLVRRGQTGRKGPVFIEFCLDAQGADSLPRSSPVVDDIESLVLQAGFDQSDINNVRQMLARAHRPLLLIGGGVNRASAEKLIPLLSALGIPIATTWNAADRISSDDPLYFGRPNTWGMRWSNVLIQQCDLLLAVGTRLGMQQTGFNWQEFTPLAQIVQVDIDQDELTKGHPKINFGIQADASEFLEALIEANNAEGNSEKLTARWESWIDFGREVEQLLPVIDSGNTHAPGFIDPFVFVKQLSGELESNDVVVPCSSGGAFTVMMQTFEQKLGQKIITNKGLASMGYGLSGAIGASLANLDSRTVLVEGDGGFAQNLQELGTISAQKLNIKIFIFSNSGYASIRMTQRNYFDGAYMGCDTSTGLGLPDWMQLFSAYGIPVKTLNVEDPFDGDTRKCLLNEGPSAFIVPIDPEQTFYPKINSRVTESGTMESSPLHLMYPDLDAEVSKIVMPYLQESANE